jgi:hypothetical protein
MSKRLKNGDTKYVETHIHNAFQQLHVLEDELVISNKLETINN